MAAFRAHPAFKRVAALLLLAVYLVASIGIIPAPRVIAGWFGTLTGERYPCEDCGCGCASATECWTHCCCHTEEQRLVWAIEQGVMPPAEVEFTDEQWIAASNAVAPGSAHCGLCVAKVKGQLRRGVATKRQVIESSSASSCCGSTRGSTCGGACSGACGKACSSSSGASSGGSCCSTSRPSVAKSVPAASGSCCSKGSKATEGDDRADRGRGWKGPTISALTCKGLEQLLTLTLPPAPPVRPMVLLVPARPVTVPSWPACRSDLAPRSRGLDVPEPPPRA